MARGVPVEGLRVRAGVPVSLRREDERLSLGNLVSAVFPHLPLDVADPVDRLRRIAHEMSAIKTRQQAQATGLLLGLVGGLPAPLEALLGRLLPDTAVVNTICTNVPGPRQRCALLGVPIADVHPFVPLLQSMGLEFAILSYADRLSIAAVVDPELVPDATLLPGFLRESLTELQHTLSLEHRTHAHGDAATGPPVAALMSRPVLTLSPDDSLERAWALMAQAHVRHLPVVGERGELVGLITHRDLLGAAPSRSSVPDEAARVRLLASVSARDVMETHLVVTNPGELAAVAGERMISGKIGALPVVEAGGRLVGILTTEDLVRWATHRMTAAA
jgi:CBS domain-containing protein